jgi:hypothetical protein
MSTEENSKRIKELRQIAFQKLLAGIVLIFVVGCFCFMMPSDDDLHSYSARKGLGLILLCGVLGLWAIVRGVIYLIRAQSGDEHYAKSVEDVMDKLESRQVKNLLGKRRKDYSTRNVLVLLAWVFLFLAVVGAICVGYSFWTRP